jgi:hypothetical protein
VTGALLEHFWWGAAVLATIPVIGATYVAVRLLVPDSRDQTEAPLDLTGAALSVIGLGALVFGLIQGPADGWTHPSVLGGITVYGMCVL